MSTSQRPMVLSFTTLCAAIFAFVVVVDGFLVVPEKVHPTKPSSLARLTTAQALSSTLPEQDWISLADGVKKRVIERGEGNVAQEGSLVEVEYTGTLYGEKDWTVQDVVDCWLKHQQGLDHLKDAFMAAQVDGAKLMDTSFFTEEFVSNELNVSNKIQCKKLVMAAKRLAKQQEDYAVGTEFDSSKERGPFKFTLGENKAIRFGTREP